MDNPFALISAEYHDAVEAAISDHDLGVAEASERLAADLTATDDPIERASILEAFDVEIAPVRDAYQAALTKAVATRDTAGQAALPEYEAFRAAAEEAKASEKEAAAGKLDQAVTLLADATTIDDIKAAMAAAIGGLKTPDTIEATP